MTFIVTCRVWQGNRRGGFIYPAHKIEVDDAAEAPSEALRIAQQKQWGTVYSVKPEAAVEVSA